MFGNPLEYRQLNAGAHRRRATNVRTPALTWHIAFWLPSDIASDSDRETLKRSLDSFILALCKTLTKDNDVKNIKLSPKIGDSAILFATIVHTDSFSVDEPHTPTEGQTDVRTSDYRVIAITFEWHSLRFTIRVELHTEYFSFTTFAELGTADTQQFLGLKDRFSQLKAVLNSDSPSQPNEELAKYFFETFWALLFQRVFTRGRMAGYESHPLFSKVFADFRGLILSNDIVPFPLSSRKDGKATWGQEAQRRYRSLVTAADTHEYSASYMLDWRAFYMSTLGPQTLEGIEGHKYEKGRRIPLTFLVHANCALSDCAADVPINTWQLGRLIDRIHLLGTVRLAALKNFTELRDAGTMLSRLEPLLKDARDAVTQHRRMGPRTSAIECITRAHDYFNGITDKFVTDTGAPTGLPYRVERSRYYIEQFNKNVVALRIKRIEGCQPYDEFVQRRLGATYDFIDRLGRRYGRAINSLTMLDQNFLAIRANFLAIQANHTGSDIRGIQRYGEIALLGALVPYYLLGLISHVVPSHNSVFLITTTIIVSSASLAAGVWRFAQPKTHPIVKKSVAALATFLIAVTIWTTIPALQRYVDSNAQDQALMPSGSDHSPK
jgi:Protein of unknown function (DUF3422)